VIATDKIPAAEILLEFRALYPEEKLWIAVIQRAILDYVNFDKINKFEKAKISNFRNCKNTRKSIEEAEILQNKAFELLQDFIFSDNSPNSMRSILESLTLLEDSNCVINQIRVRVDQHKNSDKFLHAFSGIVD